MGRQTAKAKDKLRTRYLRNLKRNLYSERKRIGLSQAQLSKESRISLSTISEIENGSVADIRLSTITALASCLDISDPLQLFLLEDDWKPTRNSLDEIESVIKILTAVSARYSKK
ncbi:MAG: helix-turn-helix domain-containing protein [Oligoflexales bacterium]